MGSLTTQVQSSEPTQRWKERTGLHSCPLTSVLELWYGAPHHTTPHTHTKHKTRATEIDLDIIYLAACEVEQTFLSSRTFEMELQAAPGRSP